MRVPPLVDVSKVRFASAVTVVPPSDVTIRLFDALLIAVIAGAVTVANVPSPR